MRVPTLFIAAFVTALWLGIPGIGASEICIKCTAPAQTYRCTVVGEDAPGDFRRQGFYCASRIAADEDHDTCAAVRREKQCPGEPRRYVYDADAPVPQVLEPSENDDDPDQAPDRAMKKDGPPETMVDLTRETARQTETNLEDAAETTRGVGEQVSDAVGNAVGAVGRAARDTVKCIGSWFDEC